MSNTRCILSCDGGGIRGLVTAVLLERLEVKLQQHDSQKKLRDYFDLIAGTSTGSLIACGVSRGIDASTIRQLYREKGITIFPKFDEVAWSLLVRIRPGYSQPIYDGEGLEQVLQKIFGEEPLRTLPVPTLVTSYDAYNRQAVVMQSNQPAFANIPIWEVCRASAAAPTAFPAHLINEPNFIASLEASGFLIPTDRLGRKAVPLIDGGVFANNPALCAVVNRRAWSDRPEEEDLLIASFGTGQNIKEIGLEAAREWGVMEWISPRKGIPILDTLFDGSSDMADYTIQGLALKENYYRFQPRLEADLPAFNAGFDNLNRLEESAEGYLSQSVVDQRLDKLVNQLLSRQIAQASTPVPV
jgi:patatin-like phospholipase/acyl hydrolase